MRLRLRVPALAIEGRSVNLACLVDVELAVVAPLLLLGVIQRLSTPCRDMCSMS